MTNPMIDSSIARSIFTITPHASNPLPQKAYGILVGGTAGNIVGTTDKGDVVSVAVAAHQTLPVVFTHILDSSTASPLYGYELF